ncbi:MAG: hypothetical protein ABR499_05625 [Gemmatimonadaceae bacterium]
MDQPSLEARVASLERQLRRTRLLIASLASLAIAAPLAAWRSAEPEVLRARGLIVVDERGRERIVIGAPIPEPAGQRIAPSTGLAIRDTAGAERFGFGLFPNGRMVMGFDAPPGTGGGPHRERITLVADEQGGARIRFLDRHTRAKALLRLGTDDQVYLELLDWQPGKIVSRRMGFRGDTPSRRSGDVRPHPTDL